jgi:hypothetical protein
LVSEPYDGDRLCAILATALGRQVRCSRYFGTTLLFIALWTPLVHYQILVRQSFHVEELLFFVAVPCVVWGRIDYRWWLAAAATFLPIVSSFTVLAEVAY